MNPKFNIPVFYIIGRARSGTTLLRTLLDHHPHLVLPPGECPFVNNLYSKYFKKKLSSERARKKFLKDLYSQPAFGYLNCNRQTLEYEILNAPENAEYRDFCKIVYLNYRPVAPKKEIKLIGDKNPDYSFFVRRLLKIFPEAQFIHIVRDPRSNVNSMLKARYESPVTASLAYRWKYYNRCIEKQKRHFPERFLTVKYEELVSNPEVLLKKICSFLGIEFDKSMFDFHLYIDEYLKIYPAEAVNKYHQSLLRPVNASSLENWKNQLKNTQVQTIEMITGTCAAYYGYPCSYSGLRLFKRLAVLPGVFYGWLYMIWGKLVSRMPYAIKMKIIFLMAKIFKPWWTKYPMQEKP